MTYLPLPRRAPLARGRSRLGASAKTRAAADRRRAIVAAVIAEAGGRCARCTDTATQGHEPATRARYPGSHVVKDLVVASCTWCNCVHGKTRAAEDEGWVLRSRADP